MRKVKGMRKAQAKEKMLFTVGVIVICLLSLVFVVRFISPSLESSREGQAKVLANMIAISANTLSTMDQGRMYKDFGLKEPLIVEITNEGGISSVKVVYDETKGNSYSVPLLVNVESLKPIRVQAVSVIKDITGKIRIEGEILDPNYLYTDVECTPTPKEKVIEYVNNAVKNPEVVGKYNYNVEAALVKAVIDAESSGIHCKDGHLNVNKKSGATGLMQLMRDTANWTNNYFGFSPHLDFRSPEDNIKLGTAYLSYLLNKYSNDKNRALAAYNWGPGNVDKYWPNIPLETQNYIPRVNACYSSCNEKTCAIC
ncbi:MAG: lytic transglycosylase domain-containing protein [Candidatus Aenigmarchaeota archaeon]|nr:lytic transglycosylase domain-containing protein [Candidatus Aenigmarchaeota archaeon]